jgi:hypothetical protein
MGLLAGEALTPFVGGAGNGLASDHTDTHSAMWCSMKGSKW